MGYPRTRSPPRRGSRVLALAAMTLLLVAGVAASGCLQQLRDQGRPGGWATDFLRASTYTELVVEIDHEPGAAPEAATVQKIERIFKDVLNKPDGVRVEIAADIDGKGRGAKYSFGEIRELERAHRDQRKGGNTAVFYIMFLDGGSDQDSGDSRVLGAAYSGSSIVLFKDNIRQVEQRCRQQTLGLPLGCPPMRTFEDAVTTHEIGHILGLVNLGVPMVHAREDPESEGHSIYESSVMYHAVRSGNIINLILRGNPVPTDFDQYDRQDLREAGGK